MPVERASARSRFLAKWQAEFFPVEATVFDGSSDPQTVLVAAAQRIVRDVVVAWDINPSIADPAVELAGRGLVGPGSEIPDFGNPALRCSRIPGGAVATAGAVVLTADRHWLIESVGKYNRVRRLLPTDPGGAITIAEPFVSVDEDVAVVFSRFSPKKPGNYWHWITEGLARAVLLQRAGIPETARVLLHEPVLPLHTESLSLIGIAPERILPWSGVATRFRTVYLVGGPPRVGSHPIAAAIAGIREHLADLHAKPRRRRLWVSRRLARRRRLDETALWSVAEQLGFEEVAAETLTVAEQAELFAEAEIIAGVHGAGLTNAVFMAPGTTICEIAPAELEVRQKVLYLNLAAAGRQAYGVYITPDGPIDAVRFERVLRRLCEVKPG